MNRTVYPAGALFALLASLTPPSIVEAQVTPSSPRAELFAAIASLDSALFGAFNRCDAAQMETFFTDDVEFYHDYNGLTTPRKVVIADFADACAKHQIGRRELVPGTLEVHPIRGHGAIEVGVHRFFVRTPNGETPGSVAKFAMVWRNAGGEWKISRVLSFDHRK